MLKVPEKYRVRFGELASSESDGNNGAFAVEFENNLLMIICSDGAGWEHVSVSMKNRCPNWKEMSFVKNLFWGEEDCVIQYHPPRSRYINNHETCLHLWRPIGKEIPCPPEILVGIKQ